MQLPIGISNFNTVITQTSLAGDHHLYVDKTLLVRDILANSAPAILITRPRRFGKTLNMSMLHHFFSKEIDGNSTKELFNNLKIATHPECMQHQGKYPVIYLTFKDIKSSSFVAAHAQVFELIRTVYLEHESQILSSDKVNHRDKKDYELFLDRKAPDIAIQAALKNLTHYLYQCYGVKPVVLIDEYDTPIQAAYLKNYYEDMVGFMREFLGAGLKDNDYLQKAVLTGILRIAKESLFSGLNNLKAYSLLDSNYGEYFGFTEPEVAELLAKTNLSSNMQDVKAWYNGYQIGNTTIYNPWSIVNSIAEQGKLSPYWVNTSDNILIKKMLIKSSLTFKTQFEALLQDKAINMRIDEHVVFGDLGLNEESIINDAVIWSLFLMSGYLKATVGQDPEQVALCKLEIPNKEVKDLYQTLIAEWLSGVNNSTVFHTFLINLLQGQMDTFADGLSTIMLQTFSVHDVKGTVPEKFYHGFMLGIIAGINRQQYKLESNKESGLGRYDIALIPTDPSKLGIILELKSIGKLSDPHLDLRSNLRLQLEADLALQQIDSKQYVATMQQHKIKRCLKVGIAFCGKELAVVHRIDDLEAEAVKKELFCNS